MNIPKTPNEPLFDIISKLSNLLIIELKEVEINKIYRIKTRNNGISRIINKFNDKNKKRRNIVSI